MREDNQMLVLTHLSQLLDLVTGIGGFIVPLVLWLTQKDKVAGMDMHGKMILNFQISLIIKYLSFIDTFSSSSVIFWFNIPLILPPNS